MADEHPSVQRRRVRDVAAILAAHRWGSCDRAFDEGVGDAANYVCDHSDEEIAAEILARVSAPPTEG